LARDIDRKLKLTAAALGTVARKDLAALFRKANPATSFDVGRADKWLQGRAQPRQQQIYDDWAKVLDLDRPGSWIADCDIEAFLDALCLRHSRDRADLQRYLSITAGHPSGADPGLALAGTFVCYSHAWSPYFRGRLVRGLLELGEAAGRRDRVAAAYSEALPTGRLKLAGSMALDKRALRGEVSDTTRTQYLNFSLFPPSPPVSVLGGLMFGTTLIGPDAQPSMSRFLAVRLPQVGPRRMADEAYLPVGRTIVEDLQAMGLPIADPASVQNCLAGFMRSADRDGIDQVAVTDYRTLVDLFDRIWLACVGGDPGGSAGAGGRALGREAENVRPFPRRGARRSSTAA
jgi:hypothetical protein